MKCPLMVFPTPSKNPFEQKKIVRKLRRRHLIEGNELFHPPKNQNRALRAFRVTAIFVFFYSYGVKSSCQS